MTNATEKMTSVGALIDQLLETNTAHRSRWDTMFGGNLPPVKCASLTDEQYYWKAKEFNVVAFVTGRQSGKTQWVIESMDQDMFLIQVNSAMIKNTIARQHEYAASVDGYRMNVDQTASYRFHLNPKATRRERPKRATPYRIIVIDDALSLSISLRIIVSIRQLLGPEAVDANTTFLFLG